MIKSQVDHPPANVQVTSRARARVTYFKMTLKLFIAFHCLLCVLSEEPEVIIIPGHSKSLESTSSDSDRDGKVIIVDDNKSKGSKENTIIVVNERSTPQVAPMSSKIPRYHYHAPLAHPYIGSTGSLFPPRSTFATGYLAGTHTTIPLPPPMPHYLADPSYSRYPFTPPSAGPDRLYTDTDDEESYGSNGLHKASDEDDEDSGKDAPDKQEEMENNTKYPTAAVMEEKERSQEEEKHRPCDLNAIKELFIMNMILMMKMNAKQIQQQVEERSSSRKCHSCKSDESFDDKGSIIYDSADASNKLSFTNGKLAPFWNPTLGKLYVPSVMGPSLPEANELSFSSLENDPASLALVPPVVETSPLLRSFFEKFINNTAKSQMKKISNEISTMSPRELMKIFKSKGISPPITPLPTASSLALPSTSSLIPKLSQSKGKSAAFTDKSNKTLSITLPPQVVKGLLSKSVKANSTTKAPHVTVQSYWSTTDTGKGHQDMVKSSSETYPDALRVHLMEDVTDVEDEPSDLESTLALDDEAPFTLD